MQKLYTGLIDRRKPIIILFAIIFVFCLICSSMVKVNYDMTDYRPEDTKSTVSLEIMEREFDGGIPNTRVMITSSVHKNNSQDFFSEQPFFIAAAAITVINLLTVLA